MADSHNVGAELRVAREAAGLTRSQLAAKVGAHRSTIDRLELDNHLPNVRTFASIARVLGVSVDDLLDIRLAASA